MASLEYTMRAVASDDVEPHRLGRQQLRFWSRLLEQGMASREARPEREVRFVDLHMRDLVRDPIGSVRGIYERFDLPLSADAEARMSRYLDRHPKDEFGVHRYSLEAFGLDAAAVDGAFARYRERFGVEAEPY